METIVEMEVVSGREGNLLVDGETERERNRESECDRGEKRERER